jgi:hypothetical protein
LGFELDGQKAGPCVLKAQVAIIPNPSDFLLTKVHFCTVKSGRKGMKRMKPLKGE